MTKEQYEIINTQRTNLELYAGRHQPGTIPSDWLIAASKVYQDVFKRPKPNLGCPACNKEMCVNLYHKLLEYEQQNQ